MCAWAPATNSAIVHAGFDAEPGTKSPFQLAGSRMMERLSQELDFPYKRNGALVLCFNEKICLGWRSCGSVAKKNGVEGLRIVSGGRAARPGERPVSGGGGSPCTPHQRHRAPFAMTIALAENAAQNGVEFFMDTPVTAITCRNGLYEITAGGRILQARTVVNAAGLYSDVCTTWSASISSPSFPQRRILPAGQKDGHLVERTVFQLPGKFGKGVLVTPTVHGETSSSAPPPWTAAARTPPHTTADGLAYATAMAERSVPNLPMRDTITSFCGLRAHLEDADDFIIGGECRWLLRCRGH